MVFSLLAQVDNCAASSHASNPIHFAFPIELFAVPPEVVNDTCTFKMAYVDENSFLGTAYTFIFLPIAAVSVRFAVRRWKRAMIGIDDWCSLAALFFTIAYCITVIVG